MAAVITVEREEGYGQRLPSCVAAGTRCRMRPVGYLSGHRPVGLDCDRPLRVVCDNCGATGAWRCANHRESRCRPCAARYRRRLRRVADSGLNRDARSYNMAMLTFTAPGTSRHRDKSSPGQPWCSCTPEGGVDLAEWNASHSRRWNHLRTMIRREFPWVEFMRGVEVQTRGALHDHVIAWSPARQWDVRVLRELAIRAGFGHEVDVAPCAPKSLRAAYYVSKYVTKACDVREQVAWAGDVVDLDTGEISRGRIPARYRTWSCSRNWGLTMKEIRVLAREAVEAINARRDESALDQAVALVDELCGPSPPAVAGLALGPAR